MWKSEFWIVLGLLVAVYLTANGVASALVYLLVKE